MPTKAVTDNSFESDVIKFQEDFCGPCHQLTPIVQKKSEEMPDVDFVSMEIDKDSVNTATEFSIRSIPQLFIMKNGKVISQKAGASDYNTVKNWLKENIS